MYLSINSVVVNFKANAFAASFQVCFSCAVECFLRLGIYFLNAESYECAVVNVVKSVKLHVWDYIVPLGRPRDHVRKFSQLVHR